MIIKWDNYKTANQYTISVEASDGSDTQTFTTNEFTHRFDNLQYDKDYNISIRCENTINGLSSKDYTMTTTTLDYPTNLSTVQPTDLIDTQARVKWNDIAYDSLAVIHDGKDSLVASIILTDEDNIAQNVIVRNLEPTTTYRVEAYINHEYKGKKRFTTTASEKYEGNIIDLRGLTEDESYKWLSQTTIDSIVTMAHPNEDITIILQGGVSYRLPTITVPETTGKLTFVTGLSLAGNAEFEVTGNFTVAAGATVKGFVFEKIYFGGVKPSDTDANYGGKYLFNIGNAGAGIGSITIKNSSIKWKRGVIRLQTSASIDSVTIDNCIIDSIGGYGIANADNAAAAINNVKVTNSTFSTCQVMFCGTKGLNPNEISIENCTFYLCGADKKCITDYKGKTIEKGVSIKKCLFGPSFGATGLAMYTGDVIPSSDGNYFTNDIVWRPKSAEDPSPTAPIDGTTLSTGVDGTFKDAAHNDFTVISGELGGKDKPNPGDQRWY